MLGPALTLALALLAVGAQPALGATGSVAGTVTAAATHQPLEGIEVCAITTAFFNGGEGELSESESGGEGLEPGSEQLGCTKTAANGEYTISGLRAGTFLVAFGNPFGGSLDYVTQYYKDKSNFREATPVSVSANATTRGIDAEMQEGAELSGVITSAATGAVVEGAIVCVGAAKESPPREVQCAVSGAGGAYSIVGVESGAVVIVALASGFSATYYGGASTLAEATTVTLAVKEDRRGVNIALKPAPPGSGPSAGTPGSGGSGSSSPVLGSGEGLPTALGHAPTVRGVGLANSSVNERGRASMFVHLTCNSTRACRGKLALSAWRIITRRGKRVRETIRVGAARFKAMPGGAFVVTVALDAAGRALLHAAHGRLLARLRIAQSEPKPAHTIVRGVLVVRKRSARRARRGSRRGRSLARAPAAS